MENEETFSSDVIEPSALQAQETAAVLSQVDIAKRYPRVAKKAIEKCALAIQENPDFAESCVYALPRDGKLIEGPSIRLAEIIAANWGNLRIGARIISEGEREVTAQAICHDLETNVVISIEEPRSIMTSGKRGQTPRRFGADMIQTTKRAAQSIAMRNAILRTVPKIYTGRLVQISKRAAVGDASSFTDKAKRIVDRLLELYQELDVERILARISSGSVEQIDAEGLSTLMTLGTSLRDRQCSVADAFPPLYDEEAKTDEKLADELGIAKPGGDAGPGGGESAPPPEGAAPAEEESINPATGEVQESPEPLVECKVCGGEGCPKCNGTGVPIAREEGG